MTIHFCDYGCGQEAKFQFKNGKWCCSKRWEYCQKTRENKRKSYDEKYGIIKSEKLKQIRRENIKGNKNPSKRPEIRKINSLKNKGKKSWCKGLTKETNLSLKSASEKLKGVKKSPEHVKKLSEALKGHKPWNKSLTKENNQSLKNVSEKLKGRKRPDSCKRMKNGGAIHANSFIKNPSKPQVELYNRIKELYPSAILNYPCYKLNYCFDIAIPDIKVCIESDGSYWHQNKEKDFERQKRIIELGWKVIRYKSDSIKDVPSIEIIQKDIITKDGKKNPIEEDQVLEILKEE